VRNTLCGSMSFPLWSSSRQGGRCHRWPCQKNIGIRTRSSPTGRIIALERSTSLATRSGLSRIGCHVMSHHKIKASTHIFYQQQEMRRRLIALLEDTTTNGIHNIKIAYFEERVLGRSYEYCFASYTPLEGEPFELDLQSAKDKRPQMEKIGLGPINIGVWRTPWTVNHRGVWLPILDTDHREYIPGNFIYTSISNQEKCNERIVHQLDMRLQFIRELEGYPNVCKSPLGQKDTLSIPRFVMESLKRDAIARKYECPISMTSIEEATEVCFTECFHIFEKESMRQWLKEKPECPLCKARVSCVQTL
jgi:hypothetical protein